MDNVSEHDELLNMGFPIETRVNTTLLDNHPNQTGGRISEQYILRPVKVLSHNMIENTTNTTNNQD